MKYEDYPAAKPSEAFVMLGTTKVKLPRPKWNASYHGKKLECNFSVYRTPYYTTIRFHSVVSWSEPILISVQPRMDTIYDIDLGWSSGGIVDGIPPVEIAVVYASLWKVANECLQRLTVAKARLDGLGA